MPTALQNQITLTAGNYGVPPAIALAVAQTDQTDPGANLSVLASVLAGNPAPAGAALNIWGSGAGSGNFTIGWH